MLSLFWRLLGKTASCCLLSNPPEAFASDPLGYLAPVRSRPADAGWFKVSFSVNSMLSLFWRFRIGGKEPEHFHIVVGCLPYVAEPY